MQRKIIAVGMVLSLFVSAIHMPMAPKSVLSAKEKTKEYLVLSRERETLSDALKGYEQIETGVDIPEEEYDDTVAVCELAASDVKELEEKNLIVEEDKIMRASGKKIKKQILICAGIKR